MGNNQDFLLAAENFRQAAIDLFEAALKHNQTLQRNYPFQCDFESMLFKISDWTTAMKRDFLHEQTAKP